jgi:type IV pilus assembly protein PilQ
MRLKNVPWDQALDLVLANNDLGMRKEGNVIWVTSSRKIKQIEAEEKKAREEALKAIEAEKERERKEREEAKALAPLVTEYIALDFAAANEIKAHIDPILTDRGAATVDERTNTIIVKDIQEIIDEVKQIRDRFDTPVKQIMIEARIVDAGTNFSRDLGVQWQSLDQTRPGFERFWQKREGAGFGLDPKAFTENGDATFGSTFSTNSPEGWAKNLGLTFARLTNRGLGTLALNASLAFAEAEGTAKVISAPKVIAREGTSATISRGDQIIIPATENVAAERLDATLSLTVTPTKVSYNNYITLDVKVTDDQAPSASRILKKSINTTLMFKSGETVVIGGIFKETKGEDTTGIPWLKDIPGLGWAFKAQSKDIQRTELLIFITPTVISAQSKH